MHVNDAWLQALQLIFTEGRKSAPRGMGILEIIGATIIINMDDPALTLKDRKLSYKFMRAEAAWILNGRDELWAHKQIGEKLKPYSDDGVRLYGAYGPRYMSQINQVFEKLIVDRDTRQAVMTFWIQNPMPSKDIPCTISLQFLIRDNELHLVANMRSSDIYMGFPYDVFSFSMIARTTLMMINPTYPSLELGQLIFNAASLHLYDKDADAARAVMFGRRELVSFPIEEIDLLSVNARGLIEQLLERS